jgi:hypothetical protein
VAANLAEPLCNRVEEFHLHPASSWQDG